VAQISHLHVTHSLLTNEVSDLHGSVVQGNVDGEMRVAEAHLVEVALPHTSHHVLNVRAHGADASKLLAGTEPEVDLDALAILGLDEVEGSVSEISDKLTTGTVDGNSLAVDLDGDLIRDTNGTGSQNQLHFATKFQGK